MLESIPGINRLHRLGKHWSIYNFHFCISVFCCTACEDIACQSLKIFDILMILRYTGCGLTSTVIDRVLLSHLYFKWFAKTTCWEALRFWKRTTAKSNEGIIVVQLHLNYIIHGRENGRRGNWRWKKKMKIEPVGGVMKMEIELVHPACYNCCRER